MKGLSHKESKQLREQARQYKAEGHTMKEVAEKFSLSLGYTQQICKGIAPQSPDMKVVRAQQVKDSLKMRESQAVEVIINLLPGFEYAGGFVGSESPVNLKCKECGHVFSRSMITIRHGKKVKCPKCLEASKEQTRIRNEKKKEKKKESVRIQSERKRIIRQWSKSNTGKQIFMRPCKECGCLFHTWKKGDRYCSDACRRKVVNRYKDNRLNDSNIIDKDITLPKLYNRDDGKCYLCGCVCDWNDKAIDDNGTVIVGGSYPTIEHVYPLSKGGLHAWDNVRLACKSCNENKRNLVPPSENVS